MLPAIPVNRIIKHTEMTNKVRAAGIGVGGEMVLVFVARIIFVEFNKSCSITGSIFFFILKEKQIHLYGTLFGPVHSDLYPYSIIIQSGEPSLAFLKMSVLLGLAK